MLVATSIESWLIWLLRSSIPESFEGGVLTLAAGLILAVFDVCSLFRRQQQRHPWQTLTSRCVVSARPMAATSYSRRFPTVARRRVVRLDGAEWLREKALFWIVSLASLAAVSGHIPNRRPSALDKTPPVPSACWATPAHLTSCRHC